MPIALLSVSDKTGIVELGRVLVDNGFTILSTGGTGRCLREAGVEVTSVSDHTGHPEVMNGRVKTLHPMIHGGILGLRDVHSEEAADHGIPWIDLVVVNLYPFEATISKPDVTMARAVEQIDIGGPTMVRAAAKNHKHVAIVTDPSDYAPIIEEISRGSIQAETRQRLALKAFQHTAAYDAMISAWLAAQMGGAMPDEGAIPIRRMETLRYGENPHQSAAFYVEPAPPGSRSLAEVTQLQGKALSFNNLADMDSTLRAVFHLEAPACVVTKHMNPCGAAVHPSGPEAAFLLALSADPVSAYGGIICFNRPIGGDVVRAIRKSRTFFEVLAAPGFTDEARELLAVREKLRVMELPADWASRRPSGRDGRRVQGGWLVQDWDLGVDIDWKVPTDRAPTDDEAGCMRFAWAMVQHVKSNAIVLARAEDGGFVLNGVGAGQMSRVDSVRIAISKATRAVQGAVLASDAFFPFPDAVEEACEAGIRAIIQPGGSIRDDAVVDAANSAETTMVMTGARHFRH
jgi:phosphoribosylaminoimidazolecarboxamide formyltransferase / IMP cyclohydrolase